MSNVWSKIGAGLGGAIIGWMLNFGGYDGLAQVQSLSAQNMIVYAYFFIPMVVAIVALILIYMYDLDKEYNQIIEVLKMRKSSLGVIPAKLTSLTEQ